MANGCASKLKHITVDVAQDSLSSAPAEHMQLLRRRTLRKTCSHKALKTELELEKKNKKIKAAIVNFSFNPVSFYNLRAY